MLAAKSNVLSILVVGLLAGLICPVRTEAETSPVEKLQKVLPDDVLGFVATSGGDNLKPAFDKSILGRLWNHPNTQTFYTSIKNEVLSKINQQMQDPNTAELPDKILELAGLALDRPIIAGAALKEAKQGLPVYGFAILDAGAQKEQIASAVTKLEALAPNGEIIEVNIGAYKMHSPKDTCRGPIYWGWVANYLLFAINDMQGLALKHLQNPRPQVPEYFKKVSGNGDVLAAYVDCRKIMSVVNAVAMQEGAVREPNTAEAVIRQLDLANIKGVSVKADFEGPDLVVNELVEVEGQRTGLLGCLKTINPEMFDKVDARAVSAAGMNFDIAGMRDTINSAIKSAAPNDVYAEIKNTIDQLESQAGIDLDKAVAENLEGPILFYMLPAGIMMEAPSGGFVVIAGVKDAASFEKTLIALGKYAAAQSEGMLQVSSQAQSDARTYHSWVIVPLAIMQVMPTWTIVDGNIVIASNATLCSLAVRQVASAGTASLRSTQGFEQATAKLPGNLIFLCYTDSKVQFNQLLIKAQQFWPMITMMAAQQGIQLPAMLPSLFDVIKDMGPTCRYCWFDSDGLRSHYQGPGIELSAAAVAGGVGASVLMPALAKARDRAKQVVSLSNLSGIGKTCLIYANDNEAGFPPNLDKLVEMDYISPKQLVSPLKPKGFDGPSYIYIAGQTATMNPGNIVAYENPAYSHDGVNVLFLDCHVAFVKREKFLRKLQETYKRLDREMPEIKFK